MSGFRMIVQDNLWFRGAPQFSNYVSMGESIVPVEPLLGRTASSDPQVKRQEFQWLLRYSGRRGRGLVISQEWIRPGDLIDDNLRATFLPVFESQGRRARWNIFYDPVLAVTQRQLADAPPVDFSRPEVRELWESDLDYLEAEYFGHPKYWRIDGKPVLYVWAVHGGIHSADDAFQGVLDRGIYLLGDALSSRIEDPDYLPSLPPLRGATGFLVVTPELSGAEREIGEVRPEFEALYGSWNSKTAAAGIDFIPAGSCQYDDTEFQSVLGGTPTRILARNAAEVEAYMATAKAAARPIDGTRYVFWGTANNWAEGTTLLPTEPAPPDTPEFFVFRCSHDICTDRIGLYGFRHLEAVKRAFFPEARDYKGPQIRSRRPRLLSEDDLGKTYSVRVDFTDCDVLGRLRLRRRGGLKVLNRPDFGTGANLTERQRFRFRWNAELLIRPKADPTAASLRVRFRNLDRQRAETIVFDGADL